jgi:hypothetical protein
MNDISIRIRDVGEGRSVEVTTQAATPPATDPAQATYAEHLAEVALQSIELEAERLLTGTATGSAH